jgi:hypothetical protein
MADIEIMVQTIISTSFENDFIRFNEPLFNELVDHGYSIEFYNNELIEFHKNNFIFKLETYCYEPLMIILNYYHEEFETLIEKDVQNEIIKFLPGLSNWNCIPAFFNGKTFSFIANFDWGWINKDSKIVNRFDGDFLSAKAIKYLSSLRKQLKYETNLKDNQFEKLVLEIKGEKITLTGKEPFEERITIKNFMLADRAENMSDIDYEISKSHLEKEGDIFEA